MTSLIKIKDVVKTFQTKGGFLVPKGAPTYALQGVSLDIKKGEIIGLVGESGCGKSTLGNTILKLLDINSGEILYNKKNISHFNKKETKEFRKHAQLIFQNPYSSLNPKMKIKEILLEPLIVHGIKNKKEQEEKLFKVLEHVGLNKEDISRFPHEFSGGQRQRIAIARALILEPEFIVADEPISALDVSIQAQIINLLIELKDKYNLTYLFISHDLNVVKYLCNRVFIMYLGQIVEQGTVEEIFNDPKHPYTKLLLSSIPNINEEKRDIKDINKSELNQMAEDFKGCNFIDRCCCKEIVCSIKAPKYAVYSETHKVKCHLAK